MKIESTTYASPSPTPSGGGLEGTRDEFLRLFMAQLQHQDPLDPKSGSDMVAQLAQLSSVEQAQQINQQLAELAAAQASSASASLSNLVGRTCEAVTGQIELASSGTTPPIEVSASGPMKDAALVITDRDGRELRRIPIPAGSRSATIAWDGKDASGLPVSPGAYQLAVEPGTSAVTITSRWRGPIDAVELTPDGPRLRMGNLLLRPADIRTIGAPESFTSPSPSSPPPQFTAGAAGPQGVLA
jgi:flagellar basal-body rod modification protein FlgD